MQRNPLGLSARLPEDLVTPTSRSENSPTAAAGGVATLTGRWRATTASPSARSNLPARSSASRCAESPARGPWGTTRGPSVFHAPAACATRRAEHALPAARAADRAPRSTSSRRASRATSHSGCSTRRCARAGCPPGGLFWFGTRLTPRTLGRPAAGSSIIDNRGALAREAKLTPRGTRDVRRRHEASPARAAGGSLIAARDRWSRTALVGPARAGWVDHSGCRRHPRRAVVGLRPRGLATRTRPSSASSPAVQARQDRPNIREATVPIRPVSTPPRSIRPTRRGRVRRIERVGALAPGQVSGRPGRGRRPRSGAAERRARAQLSGDALLVAGRVRHGHSGPTTG